MAATASVWKSCYNFDGNGYVYLLKRKTIFGNLLIFDKKKLPGYTNIEARIGLRSCSNNIDQTISFIADRREQLKTARKKARAERRTKHAISKTKDDKWVNPRTLHTLCEMGFDKDISAIALQKTDNNIEQAVSRKKRMACGWTIVRPDLKLTKNNFYSRLDVIDPN